MTDTSINLPRRARLCRVSGSLIAGACAVVVTAYARPAVAHHSALAPLRPAATPGWQASESSLQTRLVVTRLEVDDIGATAWTWLLAARIHLGRGLDLRVRMPVHMLDIQGMASRAGIGDASAGLGWTIHNRGPLTLAVSLDAFVPLGDGSDGLGGGAFAVEPGAHAAYAIAPSWQILADTSLFAQLADADAGPSLIDRYASTELSAGVGVARADRRTYARGGVRAIAALAPSEVAGEVFAASEATVRVRAFDELWVGANAEIPLNGGGKFDWRVGVGVSYHFGASARRPAVAVARR